MTSKTAAAARSAIDRHSGKAGKPRARARLGRRGKPSRAGLPARALERFVEGG